MRSSNENNFARRGEVWLVNFNPGRGSEQRGVRPAVIIQNDTGNQYAATVIVTAVTSTIKLYPVTVFVPAKSCGLPKDSMVNLAQILTVDKNRLMKRLGKLQPEQLDAVNHAIQISLAID